MSNGTLEIIKQYISNELGVELIPIQSTEWNIATFSVCIKGKTIRISITELFVNVSEESSNIVRDLEQFDILAFIQRNPGCDILFDNGMVVDPTNY